jgi:hypothetical protein
VYLLLLAMFPAALISAMSADMDTTVPALILWLAIISVYQIGRPFRSES